MRWDDETQLDDDLPTLGLFRSWAQVVIVLSLYVPVLLLALWLGSRLMGEGR